MRAKRSEGKRKEDERETQEKEDERDVRIGEKTIRKEERKY